LLQPRAELLLNVRAILRERRPGEDGEDGERGGNGAGPEGSAAGQGATERARPRLRRRREGGHGAGIPPCCASPPTCTLNAEAFTSLEGFRHDLAPKRPDAGAGR
jgi:hypothetical protein